MSDTELLNAFERKDEDGMMQQLAAGADPAAGGGIVIRSAAARNFRRLAAQLLQDPRVDPVAHGMLDIAASLGYIEMVQMLLRDRRVTVTQRALHDAAFYGYPEVLKTLLEHPRLDPKDVNVRQLLYLTPLGGGKKMSDWVKDWSRRKGVRPY